MKLVLASYLEFQLLQNKFVYDIFGHLVESNTSQVICKVVCQQSVIVNVCNDLRVGSFLTLQILNICRQYVFDLEFFGYRATLDLAHEIVLYIIAIV